MKKNLISTTLETISHYDMLPRGAHVIAAVSGGADSVCLLSALLALQERFDLTVSAVHINHKIRGANADADEDFVKWLCRSRGVKLCVYAVDVPRLAKRYGASLEDAGRTARYACYEKARQKLSADRIAVAHTKDDNAETVVMRLCRGTGLNGLGGIPPARGVIIRPLIRASRCDVLEYCEKNNLNWVTDETNADTAFTRNNIRASLLPLMRELNPKITDTLSRTASLCRLDAEFLDEVSSGVLSACLSKNSLDVQTLKHHHDCLRKRVLRKWLETALKRDVSLAHIESVESLISRGKSGNRVNLPKNVVVSLEYGELKILNPYVTRRYCYDLLPDEKIYVEEAGLTALFTRQNGVWENALTFKTFNGDKINQPQIRSRKPRDHVFVEKIGGSKKISDYFSDRKLTREKRDATPLLADGRDVLWVIDDKGLDSDYFKSGVTEKNAVRVIIWEGHYGDR
ncbi:MAG: tRNA lysidine(34) synthetase TilS [Clostridiales bacterium]|jgi:tRNA(Ile)-lysidine synthase|nr:tRNA lysidine(34) synthetase TilS [Clostridiales bacterium]